MFAYTESLRKEANGLRAVFSSKYDNQASAFFLIEFTLQRDQYPMDAFSSGQVPATTISCTRSTSTSPRDPRNITGK